MKGGRIFLEGYTLEQLAEVLKPLVQPNAPVQPTSNEDELLSREEVCTLLKISKTTLNTHTNKGDLKSYSIGGNRVLYKRSEVLAAVKPLEK
jgi:excisionase family DNA binding protein